MWICATRDVSGIDRVVDEASHYHFSLRGH